MRKKISVVEGPALIMRMEYGHLTVGELGNALVRMQAALRSLADIGPGQSAWKYSSAQPRYIASSINTGSSVDLKSRNLAYM